MRLTILSTLVACAAFAQSSDSVIFRAVMLPENEVPASRIEARATAQLRARIVRDASGQIVSGSLDFTILHTFATAQTLVGLHIHRGVAGVNGPVVIDTGISSTASVIAEPGRNGFARQAQIRPTDTVALLALRELVEDPASFYVNLHTPEFPGGVIRGQVDATLVSQFVTALSPANEIPAISGSAASGLCAIQVIRGFDGQGKFSYGEVLFEAAYDFKEQVTVNGFHIHQGGPDMNAPVVINTGISGAAPLLTPEGGSGAASYTVEFGPTLANEILLGDLSRFPDLFYVNMHTTAFPGGLIRGQLREAETRRFDMTMLPSNEVPPVTGLAATAVSNVQAFAARDATGSINAALVVFDVNFRFPVAAVEFTGLHIHDGEAGANGPVTIDSGVSARASVTSTTGQGNITRRVRVSGGPALETVTSMFVRPEKHYLNLHTAVNPGGAVRAQLK